MSTHTRLPDDAWANERLAAELERMLAGPIAEPGLRERIRTQYINLKDLENGNGPENHSCI